MKYKIILKRFEGVLIGVFLDYLKEIVKDDLECCIPI
jgi:hypothetical protein